MPDQSCPYHESERWAPRPRAAGDPGLRTPPCGNPARLCEHCGTANRSYATVCRHCGEPVDEPDGSELVRHVLQALWRGAAEGVASSRAISLPAAVGEPSLMAERLGFLVVGTRTGKLLLLNALAPDTVLHELTLPHPVVAANVEGVPDELYRGVPALLVTTERAVFRVNLLPEPTAVCLWEAPARGRCAGPAVSLREGALVFAEAENDHVQVDWVSLPSGEARSLGTFPGPFGTPLRLDGDRAFFFSAGAGHLFNSAGMGEVRSVEFKLTPDVAYPPAYLKATDEVFLVYSRDREYGIARVPAAELGAWRCTEAVYQAVQVLPLDRRALCVASSADLEFLSPLTGARSWSLQANHHTDTLDMSRFPPVRAEGHLLVAARSRAPGSMLLCLPLSQDGLREGPRRLGVVEHPVLPPLAVPAGVVCAEFMGGAARLTLVQPREAGA